MLNNGPNVRDEIRERVQRAVQMLDYKVNIQARNLAGGTSRQIALIHASDLDSEPNSYYHSGLELGALRACAEKGFQLVTHTVNHTLLTAEQRIVAMIDEKRCDGLILTPPFSDRVELVDSIRLRGCPVICIAGGDDVRPFAATVGINDRAAGFEVTRHLIDLGHRKFGYIKGSSGHLSASERYDGFLDALKSAGIPPADAIVEPGNFTFQSGIEAAQRILGRSNRPTALVCANDDMAAGALLAIHKMGLEIPRDISVTGFDDTPVSEIVWPPLTTVHQPLKQIGQRAVDLLIDAINAINSGTGEVAPKHQIIDFRLVTRESSAPPR